MAASNFGISKTTQPSYLLKFKKQEIPADFEFTARNYVKKIFSATLGLELVECFKQVASYFMVSPRRML
jgi:hypothetical protein